ncbi:hypothetical protein NDU88_009934 [Pleurodeles waltl]|uniref:Uncharacterized protein n=1 Tax=Pleurodeles waltl TaxID=8319 RepID=A0AAV7S150_PLEWA|nr:hypothetical protein NDU88_009934 [Pleurodeles waltl]
MRRAPEALRRVGGWAARAEWRVLCRSGFGIGARRQLDQEVSSIERQLLQHESEVVQNPSGLSRLLGVRKTHAELVERLRSLN